MIFARRTPPRPTNVAPTIDATIEIAPSKMREGRGARQGRPEKKVPEQHRSDGRDAVRLEKVGGHTGAVTDIVADIVGNNCGIARVVLRDSGFDFTDQIGAHVCRLGVDAAAEARENRDQRAAKRESNHRVE